MDESGRESRPFDDENDQNASMESIGFIDSPKPVSVDESNKKQDSLIGFFKGILGTPAAKTLGFQSSGMLKQQASSLEEERDSSPATIMKQELFKADSIKQPSPDFDGQGENSREESLAFRQSLAIPSENPFLSIDVNRDDDVDAAKEVADLEKKSSNTALKVVGAPQKQKEQEEAALAFGAPGVSGGGDVALAPGSVVNGSDKVGTNTNMSNDPPPPPCLGKTDLTDQDCIPVEEDVQDEMPDVTEVIDENSAESNVNKDEKGILGGVPPVDPPLNLPAKDKKEDANGFTAGNKKGKQDNTSPMPSSTKSNKSDLTNMGSGILKVEDNYESSDEEAPGEGKPTPGQASRLRLGRRRSSGAASSHRRTGSGASAHSADTEGGGGGARSGGGAGGGSQANLLEKETSLAIARVLQALRMQRSAPTVEVARKDLELLLRKLMREERGAAAAAGVGTAGSFTSSRGGSSVGGGPGSVQGAPSQPRPRGLSRSQSRGSGGGRPASSAGRCTPRGASPGLEGGGGGGGGEVAAGPAVPWSPAAVTPVPGGEGASIEEVFRHQRLRSVSSANRSLGKLRPVGAGGPKGPSASHSPAAEGPSLSPIPATPDTSSAVAVAPEEAGAAAAAAVQGGRPKGPVRRSIIAEALNQPPPNDDAATSSKKSLADMFW